MRAQWGIGTQVFSISGCGGSSVRADVPMYTYSIYSIYTSSYII